MSESMNCPAVSAIGLNSDNWLTYSSIGISGLPKGMAKSGVQVKLPASMDDISSFTQLFESSHQPRIKTIILPVNCFINLRCKRIHFVKYFVILLSFLIRDYPIKIDTKTLSYEKINRFTFGFCPGLLHLGKSCGFQ